MRHQELVRSYSGLAPRAQEPAVLLEVAQPYPREGRQRLIDDIGRGPTEPVRPLARFSILMRTLA